MKTTIQTPEKLSFPRIQSLWFGLKIPFLAGRIIVKDRTLLLLSLIPIALTIALYIYVIGGVQNWATAQMSEYYRIWGWDPQGWVVWIASLITQLILIIVGALTFAFTSSIIASPFNDLLAEKTESRSTPIMTPSDQSGFKHQVRLIFIDLAKTVAAGGAGILAIILSWVPFVNFVAFAIAFLLIAFQYVSYPQTRRGVPLKRGVRFLWDYFYVCVGFGATVTFLFSLPFVASFALPMAVVGGTLLVARAPGNSQLPRLK
ncbi:MAG: hypothetical protein CL678_05225 [Bdellovibrionaceae bacterium]|nr:hypothetical protein [Pseudobdellovibrionaceae bacterium]|tara:strand:- start:456 stop:1235 length:780 start_codon:yes stop_codon:yes gene_type:complete